jgi:hypothetical protein
MSSFTTEYSRSWYGNSLARDCLGSLQKVGNVLTWVPVKTYSGVLLGTVFDMP